VTRGQRAAHPLVWLVLAPMLLLLVALAVGTRSDAFAPPPPPFVVAAHYARQVLHFDFVGIQRQ